MLLAIWTILVALEWSEGDAQRPAQLEPEKIASMLAAERRVFRNYRETGEP